FIDCVLRLCSLFPLDVSHTSTSFIFFFFFFFNVTATTEIYTLSLHDALPISYAKRGIEVLFLVDPIDEWLLERLREFDGHPLKRSEEHTSELQSRVDLVCRLLLEKKKKS